GDVADGDLARDGRPPTRARDRGPQHLVEVRRHDPALGRSFRTAVARGNHDRRDQAVRAPEAAPPQPVGISGSAAEALVEGLAGGRRAALFLESVEHVAEDGGDLGARHAGECSTRDYNRWPSPLTVGTSEESFVTLIGARIKRKEDGRFLRGRGRYLDDVPVAGVLHA